MAAHYLNGAASDSTLLSSLRPGGSASIYDVKAIMAQTEAEKSADSDAAVWQQKCNEAMQNGFAQLMSVMGTRSAMVTAIRSSLIPR
jgi:hypothetical protein